MNASAQGKIGSGRVVTAAIVVVSALLGMLVAWRAPGVEAYARDLLVRARGVLPAPDDIAIVAIDEASMKRFGRFPWPRSVMARTIATLAAGQPKAIAVDILITDPTVEAEDRALAEAISKAGNVVAAAQLIEAPASGGPSAWLQPLPAVARAAAAVGHVNVLTESEGVARELLLRGADDSGRTLLALPVETLRVGQRLSEQGVVDNGRALLVGSHVIPTRQAGPSVLLSGGAAGGGVERLPALRMPIDYIGPAGAFAASTYSLADVVEGRVQPSVFHGRYVLIGATAASMGDRLSSPFVHHNDVQGNQHGSLMPGVEVLANALNTILRSRFYREVSEGVGLFWTALIAALTLALLSISEGRHAGVKQVASLAGVALGVLLAAYVAYVHLLVVVPTTAGVVSFASAGLLGLLRRSMATSARLDEAIDEMARGEDLFAPAASANGAEAIARLTGSAAVAIFAPGVDGRARTVAWSGRTPVARIDGRRTALTANADYPERIFALPAEMAARHTIVIEPLERGANPAVLVMMQAEGNTPPRDSLKLAVAIARNCARNSRQEDVPAAGRWPQGLEGKAQSIRKLNNRLIERARFVDSALRSVEDGLIIAAPDGHIHFANRQAAAILGSGDDGLVGADLLERLAACDSSAGSATAGREMMARVLIERTPAEREITVRGVRTRQFVLRMAATPGGEVLGIVASLSDITRQKELQQTKNDVISLVSHEMRTPLTAIQGMSEVLANYDVDPAKRREINLAINDEVKRLTRMITEYLDITRLENGATVMRKSAIRVDTVIERTLVLLEPVAAAKSIRLTRRFDPEAPALLADPDLLARAVQNLVSNAVKYSPQGTEVIVSTRVVGDSVLVEVADRGFGIPASDLARVFEKFYRVPRVQDADVPGTGLGLSLVKEIMELHGGSVTVQSEVGQGSIFTIALPSAPTTEMTS
jgi:PAS domain S-box-containing protein